LHVFEFKYTVGRGPGWWLSFGGHTSGKKGTTMELLVLAIVVIVAFGLYRYMRARAAR
jgi:hypothetical protein